ncbi:MAG: carboxypeptidase-like regulatory domain-containing protein [Planctomycetaceae bacterium]|nr:carboxypeptidase-like regulatory domain-containing protein [Planctomycetaceae bacterium]
MTRLKLINYFVMGCMILTMSGCGTNLTKVAGKVTLDGQPVENATVTLVQKNNLSIMATGKTNAKGEYSMMTFRGGDKAIKGVNPGDYVVSIVKKEEDGPPKKDTSDMTIEEKVNYEMSLTGGGMMRKNYIYHVPQKYEIAERSGLTVEVPTKGAIVKNFELVSE